MPNKPHAPRGAPNKKSTTASSTSAKDSAKADPKSGSGKKGQSSAVKEKDDKKSSGKKQDGKSGQASKTTDPPEEAPKKPDTRTLIGGASWTGKLPVTLLAELCQKQKWNKPEYTMSRIPSGFISGVILSSKDMKTGDTTTLPIIEIPRDQREVVAEPTAVEARHFAATYAMFRITSMKNTHMMMPPKYKDLWKGLFQDLKKRDVESGKAWTYEADPFATARQREEDEKKRIKKREEEERLKAKRAQDPKLAFAPPKSKAWERAPTVELGKRVRLDVEALVQQQTVWNSKGITPTPALKSQVMNELSKLGFRQSHVQEALDICKDKEEVLEWLLAHVPEDDLPPWSLPENYIAGVSMARSDLKAEAAISRLALSGYSRDLCEETLEANKGNETAAASALQSRLLNDTTSSEDDFLELEDDGTWAEELEAVLSVFSDRCFKKSKTCVEIVARPENVKATIKIQVDKSSNYPMREPILSIKADLPAYIRLSLTKQALLYARESLLGDQMIFGLLDWVEQNAAHIIANPGRLSEVSAVAVAGEVKPSMARSKATHRQQIHPIDWTRGSKKSQDILSAYEQKQSNPKHQNLLFDRQGLPAWQVREDIIKAVNKNKVTIISGETGSGKSTQSVQFVLDDLIERGFGGAANIICTQPRRISALGLADRVSEERGDTVGNEVGYIIRGDSKVKRGATRITFVTTGVLLRRLQTSGGSTKDIVAALADVSHIFIDEVHERAVDADFLLVLLKDVLRSRQDLRVILMSATADAEGFERYFSEIGTVGRVHVRGRTFPVVDFYKDDVIRMTGYGGMEMDDDDNDELDQFKLSKALQATGMKIDYGFIARTVEHIDRQLGSQEGGILIFLPGTMEINRTLDRLSNSRFWALPLHASLPPGEQRRVFPPAPKGKRKVIAATNVAETSITIPDIVAVIDTGRVKETTYDPDTSTQRLVEAWASRAACAQRRGRAGRVQEGFCYKLFTRNAEQKMRERPDPEITRVPLEQLCLSVKSMGVEDVSAFLASALTPPSSPAVNAALELLTRVGALEDGELTALGKHLAMIPADLKCAKLLVLGCTFQCVDACLTISALLGGRSPFFNTLDKREEVKKIRYDFAPGLGDLISDLRAYEAWQENRRQLSHRDLRAWCGENFLNPQTLRDVESNRAQFVSALQDMGFLPWKYSQSSANNNEFNAQNTNTPLIRALIAASLHPNIASISFPATKFAASHTGALALDPEARTIKYFAADSSRVFIHPSSTTFEAKGWSSDSKFLAFWERFASGEGDRSKPYARGVTPVNVLSVLLFGGPLAVDTLGRGVVVDGWINVRGWARIFVLVGRMRKLLDGVLERRVDAPQGPLEAHEVKILDVVRRLVEKDGLDR
ncbi:P-loop containing nucleoside triphosphate hydrolase protein [Microthyrium microscopicum]|uniref:RNA helicase n=1 Tax=Microthyrium microscopicum TaxID=703497 RepID=A0A6A6TZG8_9PEZI|nr:P-loop containing nucleoside triphosphate hydrolase protein [Microthyrium microscopicum]